MEKEAICPVCFRHCKLKEGQSGFCRGRKCVDGEVICDNYGMLTSIALDPIEKKPLAMFMPGSMILSVGSYGCNLACPFCQNHEISYSCEPDPEPVPMRYVSPEELCSIAMSEQPYGNIGVAYTYNESLISWEYIRDAGRLVHEKGMKNVLVSNGTCEAEILREILPYIDAMNIDLKGFSSSFYKDYLKGDLDQTKEFIKTAAACPACHLELTTLIIPGHNDTEDEMREMTGWIASLPGGEAIPYHISRYFPRNKTLDIPATDVSLIYGLADVAREKLKHVFTGNC